MLLKGDTNSTKVGGFLTTLWFKLQAHKGNATEVAKIWSKKNINFLQFSQSLSGLFQGQLFGIIKERRSLLTLKLLSLSFIFWVLILILSYWSHPQKFGPQINRSVYFVSTGSGIYYMAASPAACNTGGSENRAILTKTQPQTNLQIPSRIPVSRWLSSIP